MKNKSSENSVYDITIRLFVLLLIIAWCLAIMYPFVNIILWSLIFAMALHPLHNMLSKKMGGRRKLASFIIVISILVIVILPVGLLINSLVDEVKGLKVSYDNGTLAIPPPEAKVKEWPIIGKELYTNWLIASENLERFVIKYKDQLVAVGGKLATGILSAIGGIIQIVVSLFIAGVILIFGESGESIRKFFRKLAGERGDEFADITMKTVSNVVKGIVGVALVLAILHGIIFLLADIPYAGIWTMLVFVLAVLQLPLILITLPVIIYLFAVNDTKIAIMWSVLIFIAGLSDNVLRPILLGRGAPVPMLIIFIGVIGGFIFSGFIGLFTGAIVMSLGYKLFMGWIDTESSVKQK